MLFLYFRSKYRKSLCTTNSRKRSSSTSIPTATVTIATAAGATITNPDTMSSKYWHTTTHWYTSATISNVNIGCDGPASTYSNNIATTDRCTRRSIESFNNSGSCIRNSRYIKIALI